MPRRSRRRNQGPGWGKPLLIVAVLLLVLGGWWWQRGRQADEAPVAAPAQSTASVNGHSEQALALPPVESTAIGDATTTPPPPRTATPPASTPAAPSAALPDYLPAEAVQTLRLIGAGGPFPHRQDGSVFANREGRLPRQPRGYYHEYTVDTPGLDHRGARRIVTGGNPPAEFYYTDDHYDSFRRFEARLPVSP